MVQAKGVFSAEKTATKPIPAINVKGKESPAKALPRS